jgi:hypothetical protein
MPDSTHQFVELYNTTAGSANIQNWTIEDSGASPQTITASSFVLAPGSFLVIGNTSLATFNSAYNVNLTSANYIDMAGSLPSLSTSADSVVIKNAGAVTQASVSYQNGAGGWPAIGADSGNSITFTRYVLYAGPSDYQAPANWARHSGQPWVPSSLLATQNDGGGWSSPGFQLPVPEPSSLGLIAFGAFLLRKVRGKK